MTQVFSFRHLFFDAVSGIEPERDPYGSPRQYFPHHKFANHKRLPLSEGGEGPFCKFSISSHWLGKAGVYTFLVDNDVVYVGECESLAERVNQGYGNISPRNCFAGGQSTNIRINRLILKAAQQGRDIRLVFRQTSGRKVLEEEMLRELSPPWNRRGTSAGAMSPTDPADRVRSAFDAGRSVFGVERLREGQMLTEKAKTESRTVGRREAARVLEELGLCKAFNPSGGINGPNCQRFGHRGPDGRWWWNVTELIGRAQQKNCASREVIECVANQYNLSLADLKYIHDETHKPLTPKQLKTSRAELEKDFRDAVLELELGLRCALPRTSETGKDRRTLGQLIEEASRRRVFTNAQQEETSFVNAIRISLNHPGQGDLSDGQILRATGSARALITNLKAGTDQ